MKRVVATVSETWQQLMDGIDQRCRLTHGTGKDAIATAYRAMPERR